MSTGGFRNGTRGHQRSGSEAAPPEKQRVAPGKVTRASKLAKPPTRAEQKESRATSPQTEPVQQKRNRAIEPAREVRNERTGRWLDTVIRPDLHPQSVEHERGAVLQTDPMGASGSRAAVQMQSRGAQSASDVHALAAQGISGAASTLPHVDQIQHAFGAHDVRGIEAHIGGPATQASQVMGANAYATGNHVAFGALPDLHTAAHEAAHVVQQRAGVRLDHGIGTVGDTHERHADAVADAVVAGRTAEPLLAVLAHGAPTAGQHTVAVQGDGGLYYNPADPTSLSPQTHYEIYGQVPKGHVLQDGRVISITDPGRFTVWVEDPKDPRAQPLVYHQSSGLVIAGPEVAGSQTTIVESYILVMPHRVLDDADHEDVRPRVEQRERFRLLARTRYEVLTDDAADTLNTRGSTLANVVGGIAGTVAGGVTGLATANPFITGGVGFGVGLAVSEAVGRNLHSWRPGDTVIWEQERDGNQVWEYVRLEGTRKGNIQDFTAAHAAHVLDRNIERRPWAELSAEHQRCWTVLGWSESRWTQGDPPASEFLGWRDLSEPEQQAAPGTPKTPGGSP